MISPALVRLFESVSPEVGGSPVDASPVEGPLDGSSVDPLVGSDSDSDCDCDSESDACVAPVDVSDPVEGDPPVLDSPAPGGLGSSPQASRAKGRSQGRTLRVMGP